MKIRASRGTCPNLPLAADRWDANAQVVPEPVIERAEAKLEADRPHR
jgi:hypothetical protein